MQFSRIVSGTMVGIKLCLHKGFSFTRDLLAPENYPRPDMVG